MDLPVDEEDGSFTNISLADDPGTKLWLSIETKQMPWAE